MYFPYLQALGASIKKPKAKVIHRTHGQLYRAGEKIKYAYLLMDGKVELTRNDSEGRKVILPSVKKGEFFGLPVVCKWRFSSHTANVIGASKLLLIPHSLLLKKFQTQPAFRLRLISQLVLQLDLLEEITNF